MAGKRNVTIEEVREALRKACAEAQGREPQDPLAAAASAEPAATGKKPPVKRRPRQAAAAKQAPKKATPARKVLVS